VAGAEATVLATTEVMGVVTAANGEVGDATAAEPTLATVEATGVVTAATVVGTDAPALVRVDVVEATVPAAVVEAGMLSVWVPKPTVAACPPLAMPTVASEPVA
jgi:hypothetical protein